MSEPYLAIQVVMMPRDGCAEQVERNCSSYGYSGIKRNRKWQRVIVAEINRDPWNERNPKEQIDVRPKNDRIDAAHEMDEMVMVDPVDRDDDEAKDIGKKSWPHFRQRSRRRIVRRFQLQHHNRDENGNDAIAERFDPIRFHFAEL